MQKKDLDSYRKNLETVASSIGKTKYDLGVLSVLLIAYGAVRLTFEIIMQCVGIKSVTAEMLNFVSHALIFCLFVCFVTVRIKVKKSNDTETLKLFDIWGFTVFFLPLTSFFLKITQLGVIINLTLPHEQGELFDIIVSAAMAIIVASAVLMTGLLLEKIYITLAAPLLVIGSVAYCLDRAFESKIAPQFIFTMAIDTLDNLDVGVFATVLAVGVILLLLSKINLKGEEKE